MIVELYKKYRPKLFKHVIGQKETCDTLQNFISAKKVPHTILFSGPSGCGKTTLARIVAKKIECHDMDLVEINAASTRGIDKMRSIQSDMSMAPLSGACRVWIIDEVHKLTSDAQSSMLKPLEDTPKKAYFFLCTTITKKLLSTIRTRSTELKVRLLTEDEILKLLHYVAMKEGRNMYGSVADKIVEFAEGSARKALVLLGQVIDMDDGEKKQLASLQPPETEKQILDLCRVIVNPRSTFRECAAILRKLDEDPETIRHSILGYMDTVLLSKGDQRSFKVIDCLRQDTMSSGRAGLHASIYEVYLK